MKSGGRQRESILADALEAVIGALYLEAGLSVCTERVTAWYESRLSQLSPDEPSKDPKTQLQEYLQAKHLPLPDYEVRSEERRVGKECRLQWRQYRKRQKRRE